MSSRAPPPAPWTTALVDGQATFAHRTVRDRIPRILDDTVAAISLPPDRARACRDLRAELTDGALRALTENTPDRAAWDAACAPFVGRSWLDVPWYFAESFFYRRLLEATGYFAPGPMRGADPFLPSKRAEEATVPDRLARFFAQRAAATLAAAVHASLWGNRADLSYAAGRAHGDHGSAADLLADDTSVAIELLRSSTRIGVLLDNAGTELAFDLVLARALTLMGVEVTLWAKSHPTFVSDATAADVARTAPLVAAACAHRVGPGSVRVTAHPYLTSAGFLVRDEIPSDLTRAFARCDVVIVKGDANYRRLVRDAPWPHRTRFADAIDFPTRVIALRTLKAEVALGLERIPSEADWMTSGRYGVVQVS